MLTHELAEELAEAAAENGRCSKYDLAEAAAEIFYCRSACISGNNIPVFVIVDNIEIQFGGFVVHYNLNLLTLFQFLLYCHQYLKLMTLLYQNEH